MTLPLSGGCFCKAVRYQISAEPTATAICHCESCRRASGGDSVAWAVLPSDGFEITDGQPQTYESSPGIFRSFCRDCGTSLTFEANSAGSDLIEFHISTLDNPDEFPPNEHTHYAERISWLAIADELPKFRGSLG